MSSPQHAPTGFATGVIILSITVFFWGAQFPIAKSAFEHVNAYHTGIARYGLPALVLIGVLVLKEGWASLRPGRDNLHATVLGLIGMCGSPAFVFGGLQFARPEIVAIIVATQPSTTAIALWLTRGQRPDLFSFACIVTAFFGVVTVVTRWGVAVMPERAELIGLAMVFAGTLCWVTYSIGTERFRHWSVLRLTALTMLPGTLGNIALAMTLGALGIVTVPETADWWEARWELLFLSVLGVLLAMLLWNSGIKRVGPLNAMLFINLIPVVTFAVRYWQGYRFHPLELLGAAMVIAALVANNIVLRRRLQRERGA